MINDPTNLPALWYEAHDKWCHAHEAAEIAEQAAKVTEAVLFDHAEGASAEAKKMWVRRQGEYKKKVLEAIQRRTAANLALGERQKLERSMDVWRTLESTKRAGMQLK